MRAVLLALLVAAPAAAAKSADPGLKKKALEAVESCRRWSGEPTGADAKRDAELAENVARSCPAAKKAVMEALKRLPNDKDIAGATLDLNELGYFPLSEKAKRRLLATAGRR